MFIELFTFVDAAFFAIGFSLLALVVIVGPFLIDSHHIKANGITGPLLAQFSDLWLGRVALRGITSITVHDLHVQHGTFVRLAPNHVSIADTRALPIVYGHGKSMTKSNFYDAFVSILPSIFTTRSREEHARKRRIVAHTFSQKSILGFEPFTHLHVRELVDRLDNISSRAVLGLSGNDGEGWRGQGGCLWLDCLPWFNYLAFDIIGDLAFGSSFGMVAAGRDTATMVKDEKAGLNATTGTVEVEEVPAIYILNKRSVFGTSLGTLPPSLRPLARKLPWYSTGAESQTALAKIAIAAVNKRLSMPVDRPDMLTRLQEGKDAYGQTMGKQELTAEALTLLIAGSDTTSNALTAITYYLAKYPSVQSKLQAELDEALSGSEDPVASFDEVKLLPYLDAVINESIRLFSPTGLGLPRIVPEEGLTVLGKHFPAGTVLSVPTYTIHRDTEVWGMDVESFRPERWLERDREVLHKAFNPFSFGPRACIGRNLAAMELLTVVATLFHRYDFVLERPDLEIDVSEGFLRKAKECRVGLKLRAN